MGTAWWCMCQHTWKAELDGVRGGSLNEIQNLLDAASGLATWWCPLRLHAPAFRSHQLYILELELHWAVAIACTQTAPL